VARFGTPPFYGAYAPLRMVNNAGVVVPPLGRGRSVTSGSGVRWTSCQQAENRTPGVTFALAELLKVAIDHSPGVPAGVESPCDFGMRLDSNLPGVPGRVESRLFGRILTNRFAPSVPARVPFVIPSLYSSLS
jgi:hypothetical protein